jgi:glucose dehydrogenase
MKDIVLFLIGVLLSLFGLFTLVQFGKDTTYLIAGISAIIIGVWVIKQSGNI